MKSSGAMPNGIPEGRACQPHSAILRFWGSPSGMGGLSLLFGIVSILIMAPKVHGSPISLTWVHATVRLENEKGQGGTGFLLVRRVNEKTAKAFVVTNKHVIHPDPEERKNARSLTLFLNVRGKDGGVEGASFSVPLMEDDQPLWREHPNPSVDVFAIDVTSLITGNPHIRNKSADYSLFATAARLREKEITEGDEVLIIGFPLGLHHTRSHSPLVRQGIIATKIGEPIRVSMPDNRRVEIPGFLVDAAIVPGSSGSPVVLKPVFGRKIGEKIEMEMAEPLLLGIVSATQLASIRVADQRFPTLAGLGIVYDAETIRETVELFFKGSEGSRGQGFQGSSETPRR